MADKHQLSPVSPAEDSEVHDRVVVVAIDESEAAGHAFQYTTRHVLRQGDHLRLIHVQPYREIVGSSHMGAPIYAVGKVCANHFYRSVYGAHLTFSLSDTRRK